MKNINITNNLISKLSLSININERNPVVKTKA